jgi:hypothetical protein
MAGASEPQRQTSDQQKVISITFTALIGAGILLALFGAIVAVFGIGNTTVLDIKWGTVEVQTSSVGLAILVVGAALAGIVALRLPAGVQVFFAGKSRFLTNMIGNRGMYFFLVGGVGCILLVLSLVFR